MQIAGRCCSHKCRCSCWPSDAHMQAAKGICLCHDGSSGGCSPGLDNQVTYGQLRDHCEFRRCRYIDWFLTTPLLLLDLLILTDITVATTIWIMAADIFMIVFGLFGAVSDHKTK